MADNTTGVDTGRRFAAAREGAAISSANRYTVRKFTPTKPGDGPQIGPATPDARRRRTDTPIEFEGTTTVHGASGSPALAARTSSARTSSASGPSDVVRTVSVISRAG